MGFGCLGRFIVFNSLDYMNGCVWSTFVRVDLSSVLVMVYLCNQNQEENEGIDLL